MQDTAAGLAEATTGVAEAATGEAGAAAGAAVAAEAAGTVGTAGTAVTAVTDSKGTALSDGVVGAPLASRVAGSQDRDRDLEAGDLEARNLEADLEDVAMTKGIVSARLERDLTAGDSKRGRLERNLTAGDSKRSSRGSRGSDPKARDLKAMMTRMDDPRPRVSQVFELKRLAAVTLAWSMAQSAKSSQISRP